jgi:SNF2 family DNA or RNA helicase
MLPEVKLYKHQDKTVEFYKTKPAILNSSEPGTGKTLTVIKHCEGMGKVLIVCPSFLCLNWKREFKLFAGEDVAIWPQTARVTLFSVDSIWRDAKPFMGLDLLVMDESTYISTVSARRTKAFHEYVKLHQPKQLILMSGTPIKNRITELYSTMLLLDYYYNEGFRRHFSNQYSFNHYFSNPVVKYLGRRQITQFEGQKNVDDLKRRLAGKWIKFTLQELEDLPDIIYDEISAEVKETKELAVVERELEEGWTLMELGAPPSGGHISTLKMESAIAKVPFAISLMKDLLDQGHGPLIVFSDHRKPVEMICEAFDNSEMIRGDTPNNIRETIVRQFQSGKIDVLVGTIKAMGIGWTLTSSNTVVMLDRSWVVSENEQAVGRIYRASQKRHCRIIEIVRPGVDTRISRTLRAKEKVIKAVGL